MVPKIRNGPYPIVMPIYFFTHCGSWVKLGHDSVNYVIAVFPPNKDGQVFWDRAKNGWAYAEPLKTWGEIAENTKRYGPSNGSGWARSDGDYGQLAMMALAGILSVTPSEPAREAYAWLQKSGAVAEK